MNTTDALRVIENRGDRPLLSILIPTLTRREHVFRPLADGLAAQVALANAADDVEILSYCDDGGLSVGMKRNALLDRARGRFVAFVDDDDEVSPDYVRLIRDAIHCHPGIDCIGVHLLITFRGRHPRESTHSLQYRDYVSRDGRYFRPPYHLNPIRREIAIRYRFADVRTSEDIDWALRIRDDRALAREYLIEPVLYYYRSRRAWWYQRALDVSEPLRHALGLRLSNRLRLGRWWQRRRPLRGFAADRASP